MQVVPPRLLQSPLYPYPSSVATSFFTLFQSELSKEEGLAIVLRDFTDLREETAFSLVTLPGLSLAVLGESRREELWRRDRGCFFYSSYLAAVVLGSARASGDEEGRKMVATSELRTPFGRRKRSAHLSKGLLFPQLPHPVIL